jgi:hypothetical protein
MKRPAQGGRHVRVEEADHIIALGISFKCQGIFNVRLNVVFNASGFAPSIACGHADRTGVNGMHLPALLSCPQCIAPFSLAGEQNAMAFAAG